MKSPFLSTLVVRLCSQNFLRRNIAKYVDLNSRTGAEARTRQAASFTCSVVSSMPGQLRLLRDLDNIVHCEKYTRTWGAMIIVQVLPIRPFHAIARKDICMLLSD